MVAPGARATLVFSVPQGSATVRRPAGDASVGFLASLRSTNTSATSGIRPVVPEQAHSRPTRGGPDERNPFLGSRGGPERGQRGSGPSIAPNRPVTGSPASTFTVNAALCTHAFARVALASK